MDTDANNVAEEDFFQFFGANKFDVGKVLRIFISSNLSPINLLHLGKLLKNSPERINIKSLEKILGKHINTLLQLISLNPKKCDKCIQIHMRFHNVFLFTLRLDVLEARIGRGHAVLDKG